MYLPDGALLLKVYAKNVLFPISFVDTTFGEEPKNDPSVENRPK
ncbi:hypothetical protein B4113_0573 [Geobacillus sp. B4113_201601]|nr:hypothetical protein B4113_0573 [Geobacillus sp. B4113_201601]